MSSEPNPRARSRDRSCERRGRERYQIGNQSPKVKRARHDSERKKSGTSTQSVIGGRSPSSTAEGQIKRREVYL